MEEVGRKLATLNARAESVDSSCDELTSKHDSLAAFCAMYSYIALGFLCKRSKRGITFAIGSSACVPSHTTHRDHRHTSSIPGISVLSRLQSRLLLHATTISKNTQHFPRLYPSRNILGCQCTFIICLLMHRVASWIAFLCCKVRGHQLQAVKLYCLICRVFKALFQSLCLHSSE